MPRGSTRRSTRTLFFRLSSLTLLLIVAATIAAPTETPRAESNIRESGGRMEISTDDGLRLALNRADGQSVVLGVDDVWFTSSGRSLVRFEEVAELPDARNHLGPETASAWGIPEAYLIEGIGGHGGTWIRVSGVDQLAPKRTVTLSQTEPRPLVLSGWCVAQVTGEAFGWLNRNLAINARACCVGGRGEMPEVSAYFGQYDHGPQYNRAVICPERPIASVDVELTVPGHECTAWYRDIRLEPAEYRIATPTDPLERIDATVEQSFALDDAELRGTLELQPVEDRIEISCRFESTKPMDRAVSVSVAVPFDAVGGLWHDDVRTSRRIEAGGIYRNADWYGAGRDGCNNRYPLGCIETEEGIGLAIGVPVEEPRVFQIEYDALHRELRVRFDIGLSPDAGRWANQGSLTVYLFRFEDGFRGAADRYHRMFAWAFRKRIERHGLWLPFMSPTAIAGGWQDFHFRFLESVGNMGWAEREGMLSFRYLEPWIHHQEFPPHVPSEEVRGAVRPRAALEVAGRVAAATALRLPLETRRLCAAYPGAYIADKWGEPQGYFFRHPDSGRNENMMITNPSLLLPPPEGSDFSYGALQKEVVRHTMTMTRQWWLRGWSPARVSTHPFLAVDTQAAAEGRQSVRLDPVEASSYYEQYLRGISQTALLERGDNGPFTLSFRARGESIPAEGTAVRWRVIFWSDDGTSEAREFPLDGLSAEWKLFSFSVDPAKLPFAVCVSLESPTWRYDPMVLWVDEVSLQAGDGARTREVLENGGFEEAELLPCRLGGAYLDTMECYTCNLNYRREHWTYAEEPLTFDCARDPALHQVFSHVAYARHVAEWLHREDRFVFGNCTPRTPFGAPYLDVLGNEVNWKPGGVWTPWPDAEFNFARFMAGEKPYCLLQYGDLTEEEQERYMKRCLFYGVLPSNQAAPSGGWYWADPVVVARHRQVFAKYAPAIVAVAEAGWQPLTLARTDPDTVWIERFGNGAIVYFTLFNPTDTGRTSVVTVDERLAMGRRCRVTDVMAGRRVRWLSRGESFQVRLDPEDAALLRVDTR